MKNKYLIYMVIFTIAVSGLFVTIPQVEAYETHNEFFYFNTYDTRNQWETFPALMVDGTTTFFASTTINGDDEIVNNNNCSGSGIGNVLYVYIRAYAYEQQTNPSGYLGLIPRTASGDGNSHNYKMTTSASWSQWFDITNDTNMPSDWTFIDIRNLDCHVLAIGVNAVPSNTHYCAKVEIKIFVENNAPDIINITPSNYQNCWNTTDNISFKLVDMENDSIDYNTSVYKMPDNTLVFYQNNTGISNNTVISMDLSSNLTNGTIYKWVINATDTEISSSNTTYFGTVCNYTCPDDKSMYENGTVNLSLNYGSWVNLTWHSWFNDSATDTLETILAINDQYINTSGVCADDSFNGTFYFNYSGFEIGYNTSHNYFWNDTNDTFWVNSEHLNFTVTKEILPFFLTGIVFSGCLFYSIKSNKNSKQKKKESDI